MRWHSVLDYEQVLQTAQAAAKAGGGVLAKYGGNVEVRFKEGLSYNLVTQADVEAEAAIVAVIREAFPSHAILGEEGEDPSVDLEAEHLWVIDPLDGTTNFTHGIPQYCTAVGFACKGEMQVGVILDPCRQETFHAIRGGGAFLNGKSISVSPARSLLEAVIATGFYYDRGELMKRTLKSIEELFGNNVRGVRRLGSAALDQCWVACGRFDAFFEYQLSPWDFAAAQIIVEEAGGRCADRMGNPLRLSGGSVIASNAELHDELLAILRW